MQSKFTAVSMGIVAIISVTLPGTLAVAPANATGYYSTSSVALSAGTWKIDVADSHFGPDYSTMVIERVDAASGATGATSNNFVVISGGKVYLADPSAAQTSNGTRKVDYSDWSNMKLVQVGESAQWIDHCGLSCQAGFADKRLTLRFKSVNGGMPPMGNVVVFNQR